jgi:pimeloyl-ACP methyl ester carboxylesterase
VAERMVETNDVALCTESFGDPADPPVLLIMGVGGSMIWWEEGFCRMLAEGGRFVVRYDHRDTGRSTAYPVGSPGYTGTDLLADATRVLDVYDIPAAHIVGVSAGGGFAQELALDRPERVLSVVLISTTFATATGRSLPGPTEEFGNFVATARVDWSDDDSVVEYMVGYQRLLAGGERPFDEPAARELVRRDIERARDYPAVQNHDSILDDGGDYPPVSSIAVPTLVIHGTADPMFPIGHGEALAEELPDARLLRLEGAGHGVYRVDWKAIVAAILEHT